MGTIKDSIGHKINKLSVEYTAIFNVNSYSQLIVRIES